LKYEQSRVSIPVGDKDHTSGILSLPGKGRKRSAVTIAHGAGNDMNTPLIASFADSLATAGYPVLRFNFLYKERGKKAPDNWDTLTRTWAAAFSYAKGLFGNTIDVWVAAGKSMGGRVASQMVAGGLLPVDRLIFLGYPLHPAGDKEKLRDSHLYRIQSPMLFFAGTRDPLCDMEKLKNVLQQLKTPWQLFVVEGGDHSFHVPKALHKTEQEIFAQIVQKSLEWLT
jgi:predicted alpha/beta-hydrolase family hydrolase